MTKGPRHKLRRGWTTGACAAAAARAAGLALRDGAFPDPVEIALPGGQRPAFALAEHRREADWAEAGIVKDAGDDPDCTHGALIRARVWPGARGTGIAFRAGEGVGTVTLPGLALGVGEPAINPVPRAMIAAAVVETFPDAVVEISIPGGEALARGTSNARLGILGGLSILGTTGIVIPYSCSSWIHSIHRGIDVARANGIAHIAASTGRTSEQAIAARYELPQIALIDMGDFAGGLLKYLREHPLPRLSIAGGFAKLSKLAQGRLDLHSRAGTVDAGWLAERAGAAGAPAETVAAMRQAISAAQILDLARQAGLPLADIVAGQARESARATLSGAVAVEVVVFDREGQAVGHAGF